MVRSVGRLVKGVVVDLPVATVSAVFGRGSRRRRVVKLEKELADERTKLREHQVRVAAIEAELAALQEQPKEQRVAKRGKPTVIVAEREVTADTAARAEVESAAVVAEAKAEAEAGLQAVVEVAEVEVLEEIETLAGEPEAAPPTMNAGYADVYPIETLDEEAEVAPAMVVTATDWVAELPKIAVVAPPTRAISSRRDDLTRVQGIGAKSAGRLYDAGVVTFAQLAALDEESLAAIIQAPDWRRPDYAQWISQAKAAVAEAQAVLADDLSRLEGIGRTYAERLRAAGIATFSQLAEADAGSLTALIQAPEWRQPDYESWIVQARLAAAQDEAGLAELQAALSRREGDNLALVQGLGAIYAAALRKAGIASFADLAATTPEQLEAIVSAAGLRHADFQAWIDEAALRAAGKRVKREKRRRPTAAPPTPCPQDLGLVKGIDVVYEQRLYEAGVGTFWELANTPDLVLAEVLQVEEFQDVDLADLKRQAAQLAVETGSEGRVWEGTAPDDFERIEGIGDVYERRLYDAGICTYGALAGATVAQLAKICQAPEFAAPDYASWIAQAQALLAVT